MSKNNLDLNKLMAMFDGNEEMKEKISKMSKLLGGSEQSEKIGDLVSDLMKKEKDDNDQVKIEARNINHNEPSINLLLALRPFLSEEKQCQLDECIEPLNMTYLIRRMGEVNTAVRGKDS
ncbi:hypothetical protein HYG86_11965 [Alkalicella caledoniensis]|uniref:Uncharacterized protein n=1 Tax=Alkalicella caledoniensis TaxID=2731377 RepID=A0A7G9W9R6_ALKCA|nr:hypothetical protein [Alkalicella caledoniensis]QNO15428.1 hypothetical protein HYG86_11965 [Alkalicella caledoniensis]